MKVHTFPSHVMGPDMGDGVVLASTEHPVIVIGKDVATIEWSEPGSPWEFGQISYVPVSGGISPQCVNIFGERMLYGAERLGIRAAVDDLLVTFEAWLAISMPVYKWRPIPEVTIQEEWEQDLTIVRFRAGVWLDIPTPAETHKVWSVVLP